VSLTLAGASQSVAQGSPPIEPSPQTLDAARARWRAAAPTDYEYGYRKYCECHREAPPETIVTVRGGLVVGVRHRHTDPAREVPAEQGNLQYYWTVEDLFALLQSATERGAEVRAAYDAALGYPAQLYIDHDTALIGDELDLRLTRVEALDH
jgi:hypothetical protein